MHSSTQNLSIKTRDLAVFSLLGTIMFLTKIAMQGIPSVHLLALFIASFTLTYRVRALIPIYIYIMLDGAFHGFSYWWMPYLYIWLPLWLFFMIAGKVRLSKEIQVPLYMILCGLHGLSFGALYAPAHALFFDLSFKKMIAWIIVGLPFDIVHAIGNLTIGTLVIPLSTVLKKLDKSY